MTFKEMKRALVSELKSESNMNLFKKQKSRHGILADHETVMSILAILDDESPRRWKEKDDIVRAIIDEDQKRSHPFWSSLLIVAFYPMLSRLRGRIVGDALSRDDLDQLVLSTFLEVIDAFPLSEKPNRICMYLRQMTQRQVFRQLRQEQTAQDMVRSANFNELECREIELTEGVDTEQLDGGHHLRWPETKPSSPHRPNQKEQTQLVAFLVDNVGDGIEGDRLELVIATQIHGERLSDLVRRCYPDMSSGDRKKAYQRIKRRHSRALAKLRELFFDFRCPQTTPQMALSLQSA